MRPLTYYSLQLLTLLFLFPAVYLIICGRVMTSRRQEDHANALYEGRVEGVIMLVLTVLLFFVFGWLRRRCKSR